MSTLNPEPLTFEDVQMTTKARLAYLIEHSSLTEHSTVDSELLFGGRPTLVLKARDTSQLGKFTEYIVYVKEQPQYFHGIWLLQFGNQTGSKWAEDFLKSVEIVLPATRLGETDAPGR
jgi:hypothetical protein